MYNMNEYFPILKLRNIWLNKICAGTQNIVLHVIYRNCFNIIHDYLLFKTFTKSNLIIINL